MLKRKLLGLNDSSQEATTSFSAPEIFQASMSVNRLRQSTFRRRVFVFLWLLLPKDSEILVIVYTEEQPIW